MVITILSAQWNCVCEQKYYGRNELIHLPLLFAAYHLCVPQARRKKTQEDPSAHHEESISSFST